MIVELLKLFNRTKTSWRYDTTRKKISAWVNLWLVNDIFQFEWRLTRLYLNFDKKQTKNKHKQTKKQKNELLLCKTWQFVKINK